MKTKILYYFAGGCLAGGGGFMLLPLLQSPISHEAPKKISENASTASGTVHRRLYPIPKLSDNLVDLNNDSLLEISTASNYQENNKLIAGFSIEILKKWMLIDPDITIPWLFRNANLFPPPRLEQIFGNPELFESPRALASLAREFSSIPDRLKYLRPLVSLERALDGQLDHLNLSQETTAAIAEATSRSGRLEALLESRKLPLDIRVAALEDLSFSDPARFEKGLNASWSELSQDQKQLMARKAASLLSSIPMDLNILKEKLIEVSAPTDGNSSIGLTNSLMNFAKSAGVEESLNVLNQLSVQSSLSDVALDTVLGPLIYTDPGAASEWLNLQPDGKIKNKAIAILVATLTSDSETALAWAEKSSDLEWKLQSVNSIKSKISAQP